MHMHTHTHRIIAILSLKFCRRHGCPSTANTSNTKNTVSLRLILYTSSPGLSERGGGGGDMRIKRLDGEIKIPRRTDRQASK